MKNEEKGAPNYTFGTPSYVYALWKELLTINFFERVPELKVPVFFFIGRHDYLTSFEVTEQYFHFLHAPSKECIWFEKSAHMALIEENEKFTNLLIEKVRPVAY